jgi:DNA polymerase III delta prime subunit
MSYLKLTPADPTAKITFNEENPLFKIVRFRFEPEDAKGFQDQYSKINLKYIKKVRPHLRTKFSDLEDSLTPADELRLDQKDTISLVDWVLNTAVDYNYDQIELTLENSEKEEISLELWYETQELHPFTVASQGFKEHIGQNGNTKILFSAPFGTGKTTFLREYFKENEEYEVFHLFPVNYSVASNEDIFKYIKVELLFDLLQRDVDFEKEGIDRKFTLPYYFSQRINDLWIPFIRLIPDIGRSVHDIVKDLVKLKVDYTAYHDSAQTDDLSDAMSFVYELIEKEGSLFEDNVYTQIIRQLIEQIKSIGKKTVLILDDLDRIDPEHIFRILNVLAAHVDQQGMTDEMANKFGFDRIILVCHYENLKKIFQHKYGSDTDFSGYVDKYFSRSIYEFDFYEIADIMMQVLIKESKSDDIRLFNRSVGALITCKILTLREIVLISNADLKLLLHHSLYPFFYIIHHLSQIMGIDRVISVTEECSFTLVNPNDRKDRTNYDFLFLYAVADLLLLGNGFSDQKNLEYSYKGYEISISLSRLYNHKSINKTTVTKDNEEVKESIFGISDFFFALKELATKYKEIGGLKGLE